MKGVGVKYGVKAETIVFLDYLKDFTHPRQAGFAGLAKFRRRIPGAARKSKILRRHGAVLRTVTWPRPPAGPALHLSRSRYLA
jgi:hypothetical protein